MKIKTQLMLTFFSATVVPLLLIMLMVAGMMRYQLHVIEETYGVEGQYDMLLGDSTQLLSRMTQTTARAVADTTKSSPDTLMDKSYLDTVNEQLSKIFSGIIVRQNNRIIYNGYREDTLTIADLPDFQDPGQNTGAGFYIDGAKENMLKQIDFRFTDGAYGSVFIVTSLSGLIPLIRQMFWQMILMAIMIMVLAGMFLTTWLFRTILQPISKLQEATKQIRDGNLDFTLEVQSDNEIGLLCQDFEDMRIRLKESAEEKVENERESRVLIRNISHDLRTPLTAIKGYVEGIRDGIADSPEKLDRYLRTIYNKTNDMDHLIDELTLYSRIDTNRIPYNFVKVRVNDYFRDCSEEVGVDMEARGVEFSYGSNVADNVKVILDPEQMKRVVNNIIGNSLKYMDKKPGRISIRILDKGDFIQTVIEDNGVGILREDLRKIFEWFYRTDKSRNSKRGGSGIGLSIVRKIIEDHGGRIWATSDENKGTAMHFELRKAEDDEKYASVSEPADEGGNGK